MTKVFDIYDGKAVKVVDAAGSPVVLGNLKPNTTYSGYSAAVAGETNNANWVKLDDFTTKDVAPAKPTIAVVKGDGKATFTITPGTNEGSDANNYTVYYTDGTTEKNLPTKTLTGEIDGLTNGTAYTFTATASNNAGESTRSEVASATPSA